uniref:Nacre protein n=1 Tax=Pinctada fucata TaxID=50426 RepID=L8B5X0_PINFU|nr:nacre protein [Pinctada fucata]
MVSHAHIVSWLFVLVIIQLEAWPCDDKSTPYNDDGNGDMAFLDRHRLRCYSKGMARFQLDLRTGEIRYEYFCCELPKNTIQFSFNTAFTFDGYGDVAYLDKQTVNCGNKAVITGFNLQRNLDGTKVRYDVICREFINISYLQCYNDATSWQSDQNGDVQALAKHNVKCASGYFINMFSLQADSNWYQIRYLYRCCKP